MSYNEFMNKIFWMCVDALNIWADQIGWTYEELNVWIFIVIHPLLTFSLMLAVWIQKHTHYQHLTELQERWTRLAESHFHNVSKINRIN